MGLLAGPRVSGFCSLEGTASPARPSVQTGRSQRRRLRGPSRSRRGLFRAGVICQGGGHVTAALGTHSHCSAHSACRRPWGRGQPWGWGWKDTPSVHEASAGSCPPSHLSPSPPRRPCCSGHLLLGSLWGVCVTPRCGWLSVARGWPAPVAHSGLVSAAIITECHQRSSSEQQKVVLPQVQRPEV